MRGDRTNRLIYFAMGLSLTLLFACDVRMAEVYQQNDPNPSGYQDLESKREASPAAIAASQNPPPKLTRSFDIQLVDQEKPNQFGVSLRWGGFKKPVTITRRKNDLEVETLRLDDMRPLEDGSFSLLDSSVEPEARYLYNLHEEGAYGSFSREIQTPLDFELYAKGPVPERNRYHRFFLRRETEFRIYESFALIVDQFIGEPGATIRLGPRPNGPPPDGPLRFFLIAREAYGSLLVDTDPHFSSSPPPAFYYELTGDKLLRFSLTPRIPQFCVQRMGGREVWPEYCDEIKKELTNVLRIREMAN